MMVSVVRLEFIGVLPYVRQAHGRVIAVEDCKWNAYVCDKTPWK